MRQDNTSPRNENHDLDLQTIDGRPKGKLSLKAILDRTLEGTVLLGQEAPNGMTIAEVFVESQIKLAMEGNSSAATQIWERIDGKVGPPEVEREDVLSDLDESDRIARQFDQEAVAEPPETIEG